MLEATAQSDLDARAQLAKWAISSGRLERIKAAIHLGRSEPGLSACPTDFDADIWIMGTLSGKLDLRTGDVSPCLPEDRVTRLIQIRFDEDATCPRWERFLEEVFASDRDLVPYIQRVVGYCLTGSVREQLFWVLWGMGANGKSVFAEVLRMILGDYYHRADPELFVTSNQGNKAGNASPQVAGLKGARLAIASETPPHGRLAETSLKELTGGDAITARFLFGNPFTFAPSHKLILLTNHKPRVSQDKAVWRRMRLLPFNRSFPPESQDKQLLEKLMAELPGIFAWAVRGSMDWAREGLNEPQCVREATREYQSSEDVVGRFIEERCVVEPTAVTPYSELYRSFNLWSQENGEPEYGTHRFAGELESRGFAAKKGSKGVRLRCGLKLGRSTATDGNLGSAVFQDQE